MTARRTRLAAEPLETRDTPAALGTFLTTPHTDLNLGYTGGASGTWSLQARDGDNGSSTAPDDTVLYAGTNAADTRPAGSQWDFLGVAAGQSVYVLPQTQDPDRLFLGFAGYGIASGAIDAYDPTTESGGRVTGSGRWAKATVVNVSGPGEFSIWQSDSFGSPVVWAATSDGLTSADAVWLLAGGHTHYNWGFSETGRYEVTFRLSAYLENGNANTAGAPTSTADVTVYFSVVNVGQFVFDPASLTVNEGAGTATVTVKRTGGSDGRVTVNYATSNGSAGSGDYTPASGTLTFNDQETEKTFTVAISDDAVGESNETINLTLSSPGPASIAGFTAGLPGGSLLGTPSTGVLTIADNDDASAPTVSAIGAQSTPEDVAKGVSFTVGVGTGGGASGSANALTVTATSSNTALVPNANVVPGGSGTSRSLNLTPTANAFGSTTITVTVKDPGNNKTAVTSFVLTVTPVSDPPLPGDDDFGVTPGNTLRGNVLLNDDPGVIGGPLTATLVTGPTGGSLVLNPNGTFAFTPGAGFSGTDTFTYRVTGPDGSAVGTVTVTGRPTEPTFEAVISEGHTDIGIAYEDDAFDPHIHDEVNDVEYEFDGALLHGRPSTATPRPAGSVFDFLGVPAGQTIWVLPQAQVAGKIFLGVGAEEIPPTDFAGDLTLQILAVDGPGLLSLWQTDAFGGVIPLFSSRDGITTGDAITFPPGDHFHENWGFTAPGLYAVTLQFSGTPTGGANAGVRTFSEPATYYFAIDPANATPVVSGPPAARVAKDGTLGIPGLSVSDAESSPGDYSVVVTATSGTVAVPGGGSGASVSLSGNLAAVNAALAGLTFTPTAGFVGPATVTVAVTDPGFLVGAENARTGSLTVAVSVDPVVVRDRFAVGAGGGGTAAVRTLDGSTARSVTPFGSSFAGGVRVASADVTGDGVLDLIAGAGPGGAPTVVVYDGVSGAEVVRFDAFESGFTGGLYVAAGDFDRDGRAEVVVSADQGGGPVVAVFRVAGGTPSELVRFLGIQDDNFRGGARAAVGDVTGDGVPDIVVSAGFLGGPRISIWDGTTIADGVKPTSPIANFFAFEDSLRNGAFVAIGDVTGDGRADLIFGGGPGGGPRVRVIDGVRMMVVANVLSSLDELLVGQVASFFAGPDADREGVRVAALDATGDGRPDVVTGSATRPTMSVFDLRTFDGTNPTAEFDPLGDVLGGIFVG